MHVARKIAATAAVGSLLLAVGITPASAQTTTTFSLTSGALSVTAPTSADLGTADLANSSLAGSLGTVSVDDQRGESLASWTVAVSADAFTTGAGTASETVPATALAYDPGVVSGSLTTLPVGTAVSDLSMAKTVVTLTDGVGSNTASWAPTVTVTIPDGIVAGSYSGTITHSIS
jgi:hypothetical protein